jgi:hypothetical protein
MRHIKPQQMQTRPVSVEDTNNYPVPAPVGGWNAIDPLALMDPKYAPVLDNWIPRTGYVELRPGYSAWIQGLASGPVESLMAYRAAGTTDRLFAACSGSIFEVTTEGVPTTAQTGISNNRWQYVNFTPATGTPTAEPNYLYIVNGQDAPRYFQGTAWTQPSITGGPSPSTFSNIAVWKRRIFFVQGGTLVAWYLGTDAIQGALAGSVDVGALCTKGGELVAIGSITVDGGNGPDDLIIFITSRGESVVYKGTDPTNANAFSLVGVFQLPPPLGARCLMDYGADLAVITLQGVIPFSLALPADSDAVRGVALTNKIQNAMLIAAAQGQTNFGWEISHYPAQGLFIVNVPTETNASQVQFVQNAVTGAWCRFVGWNANCFALMNDQLFFGDNSGNVNLAYSGPADLVSPIVADMQCAFNYFGDPGRLKEILMVQPLMITSGTITPTISIDVDFGSVSPAALVTSPMPAGALYDVSLWDASFYASGFQTQDLWQDAIGEGHALAVRMKVNTVPSGPGGTSVFDTGVFDTMVFDGFGTTPTTLQIMAFNALVRKGGFI